jgi:hypothetical protein
MQTAAMVTSVGIRNTDIRPQQKSTTITTLLQQSMTSLLFPRLTFSFLQTTYIYASFKVFAAA